MSEPGYANAGAYRFSPRADVFPTDELPRFYLFDWQYPSKAIAAEDVVHAIVNDLEVEQRRHHETTLFDLYYESLCEFGVTDLSRERFWFQCRISLIWLILMDFRSLAAPDLLQILQNEAEEAGDNWQDWIFGVIGPLMEDWDLSGAIDQAVYETIHSTR